MFFNIDKLNKEYETIPDQLNEADVDHATSLISAGKVDEAAEFIANIIMVGMYGKQVRGSLALWTKLVAEICDKMFADYLEDQAVAAALQKLLDRLQSEWKDTLAGLTEDSEVKNARVDVYGVVWKTLKERLDNIESKVPDLILANEVTDRVKNLKLNGFTTSSEPLKYEVESNTSANNEGWKAPLAIQPVSKISYVKVSEIK